ncbi:MAG: NUDIX hydrolase [Woeseia sp.]|nr:NUDIX hydrolase [Woeseia sp.]NNE61058.1 NUDIX hydrolase [Woeseia sp.]NNL55321.1 NUDIX hydrolase [Woeseia sp.]
MKKKDAALTWKKLHSEAGPELPLFGVRIDTLQHPVSAASFKRLVLEAPDWVTVVATTCDDKIIMVEQFRFGVGELTIEPVGGIIDAGEKSLAAAQRELLEETGFGEGRWRYLGSVQGNPAIQNNLCHHWLAEGVVRLQEPSPDEGEAIQVHTLTLPELKEAIAVGTLKHPLGLSALSRVFPLWEYPYAQPTGPDDT